MSIDLKKGQKVSLQKHLPGGFGEILVNLNWNSQPVNRKQGFFAGLLGNQGIDLDLGCLYELKDGKKGTVQALGKSFGYFERSPYILLDGDDRTGNVDTGENLRINGNMLHKIKRVLVYTYIYEGVANWKEADAVVTIKYPGAENLVVAMDDYNASDMMCALVLLENINDETFSVEKLVQFYQGHKKLDKAFRWGLKWKVGHK